MHSTICNGNSTTLTANTTPGSGTISTYSWSSGITGNLSGGSVSPTSNTTYMVTVTNSNNCSATDSASVAVNNIPTAVPSATDSTICNGNSTTLAANATPGSGTISTYSWSSGIAGNLSGGSVSPTGDITYTVTVINSNNCSATASLSVTVNSSISATITNSGSTTFCQGDSVTLTANSSNNYSWSNSQSTQSITVNQSGNFTVTVSNVSNCSATAAQAIKVNPLPTNTIHADRTIFCANDSTQICAITGFSIYLWNHGENTSCIYASLADNYYVTVRDSNNCSSESNHISVSIYPLPSDSINVNGDTLSVFSALSYQWYLNGNPINAATNPIYITNQAGSYTVQTTDSNGCRATSNAVVFTDIFETGNSHSFSIYPNPATNQLYIQTNGIAITELNIYNVTGALVSQVKQLQGGKIDISNLAQGSYIVEIKNNYLSVRKMWVKI